MLHPEAPAKCCSYCGGRDHNFEDCPKRKADAEKQKEEARAELDRAREKSPSN